MAKKKKAVTGTAQAGPSIKGHWDGWNAALDDAPQTFIVQAPLAQSLAAKHGDRFTPNALLLEMAENGETFYGRFGDKAKAAA